MLALIFGAVHGWLGDAHSAYHMHIVHAIPHRTQRIHGIHIVPIEHIFSSTAFTFFNSNHRFLLQFLVTAIVYAVSSLNAVCAACLGWMAAAAVASSEKATERPIKMT